MVTTQEIIVMDYPSNAINSWLLKWIVLPFAMLLMVFLCITYFYGVHQCRSACKKVGYTNFTYSIGSRGTLYQEVCACVTDIEKQPLAGESAPQQNLQKAQHHQPGKTDDAGRATSDPGFCFNTADDRHR